MAPLPALLRYHCNLPNQAMVFEGKDVVKTGAPAPGAGGLLAPLGARMQGCCRWHATAQLCCAMLSHGQCYCYVPSLFVQPPCSCSGMLPGRTMIGATNPLASAPGTIR